MSTDSERNGPPPREHDASGVPDVSESSPTPVAIEVGGHRYEFIPPASGEASLLVGGVSIVVAATAPAAPTPSVPVSRALGEWIAMLTADRHSAREIGLKRSCVNRFTEQLGWEHVSDITREDVLSAKGLMTGVSPKTVRLNLSRFKKFMDFCVEAGYATENPAASVPLPPLIAGEGQRGFTQDEVDALLATTPEPRRHIYRLAAYTGLRWSELRRLRWRHVFLHADEPHLVLPAAITKNRRREVLPLLAPAIPALRGVLDARTGPDASVFKMCDERTIISDMERAGVAVVDDHDRRASFHSFRKFFGTALARGGANPNLIQRLMRHSSFETTRKIYIEAGQIDGRQDAEAALSVAAQLDVAGALEDAMR